MNIRKLIPYCVGSLFFFALLACANTPGASAPTATVAAEPTTGAVPGHITGHAHLDGPPTPRLVIYVLDVTPGTNHWGSVETEPADGEAPFDIAVQPGTYQVFAFVADQPTLGMGYSTDNLTLAPITVAANQTVSDINVRPPSQSQCGAMFGLPASPDGRFPAIPGPSADCIAGMQQTPPTGGGAGAYIPVSTEVCQTIKESAEQATGLTFTIQASVPFQPFAEVEGQACSLTAHTTGTQITDPVAELDALVKGMVGWTEETSMQAGGPTGAATGMRRDAGLMILSVRWEPSAEVQCPQDQPIASCDVKPEQQLYTVQINTAMK